MSLPAQTLPPSPPVPLHSAFTPCLLFCCPPATWTRCQPAGPGAPSPRPSATSAFCYPLSFYAVACLEALVPSSCACVCSSRLEPPCLVPATWPPWRTASTLPTTCCCKGDLKISNHHNLCRHHHHHHKSRCDVSAQRTPPLEASIVTITMCSLKQSDMYGSLGIAVQCPCLTQHSCCATC